MGYSRKAIGNFATVRSGFAFRRADWSPSGVPVVKIANVKNGCVDLSSTDYVPVEVADSARNAELSEGDLLITMSGVIGEVGLIRNLETRAVLNQRVGKFRLEDPDSLDVRFLFYALRLPDVRRELEGAAYGVAQPNISPTLIQKAEIPVPPLPIQRRIAGILSAYDDLIENCERRIRVLDEMARALYREWFVHFRYPGHEKTPPVESKIGRIPKGWRFDRAGSVVRETRKGVPKGELLDGPTRYVGLEHIPRRSLALNDWEEVTCLGSNKLQFERGEVLFGKIRPYFHKVSVAPFAGVCSADTFVISAREPHMHAFTTCLVSSDGFVAHANATSNGAKMPRANWDVMMDFPLAIPPPSLLEPFSRVVDPWIDNQQSLVLLAANLRQTRDLLLPRLLSGQLSVEKVA